MKIVLDAVDKCGSVSALHKELIRRGVDVSLAGVAKMAKGLTSSLRNDILAALVDIAYQGDWSKAGKSIKAK